MRATCISKGVDAISVSLRLPPELNQRLSNLAERELEAVRAGKSKAVPLEDVMKQYGLAD